MQQIQQIERVLQREYGVAPREIKNTWLNRYFDYITQNRYNPIVGFLGGLIIASVQCGNGFYRGKDHTIWTPDKLTPFSKFAVLHELTHGYTRQRNNQFQELEGLLAKEGAKSWMGGSFSRQTIEEAFLHRCVDEGIADYVAISAQKLDVEEGRLSPEDAYCFEREWMLVQFKDPENGANFAESTPLNYEKATKLEEIGNSLIEFFLSVNETKGMEKLKKSMVAVKKFNCCAYVLGHYLVRATVNDQHEEIGQGIDQLIENPPKSVKEIQQIALSAF